jgi:hypothetical protein
MMSSIQVGRGVFTGDQHPQNRNYATPLGDLYALKQVRVC